MKKIFLIVGIVIFVLLAIGSLVASNGGRKLSDEKNKKSQLLFTEVEKNIKDNNFKEARLNLEKLLDQQQQLTLISLIYF